MGRSLRPSEPVPTTPTPEGDRPPLSPGILTGPEAARRARRPAPTAVGAGAGATARAGRNSFFGSGGALRLERGPGQGWARARVRAQPSSRRRRGPFVRSPRAVRPAPCAPLCARPSWGSPGPAPSPDPPRLRARPARPARPTPGRTLLGRLLRPSPDPDPPHPFLRPSPHLLPDPPGPCPIPPEPASSPPTRIRPRIPPSPPAPPRTRPPTALSSAPSVHLEPAPSLASRPLPPQPPPLWPPPRAHPYPGAAGSGRRLQPRSHRGRCAPGPGLYLVPSTVRAARGAEDPLGKQSSQGSNLPDPHLPQAPICPLISPLPYPQCPQIPWARPLSLWASESPFPSHTAGVDGHPLSLQEQGVPSCPSPCGHFSDGPAVLGPTGRWHILYHVPVLDPLPPMWSPLPPATNCSPKIPVLTTPPPARNPRGSLFILCFIFMF